MPTLKQVEGIPDPEERARAAAKLLRTREEKCQAEIDSIRQVRDGAVVAMLATGARPADAARAIGVSRAAITNRFGAKDLTRPKPATSVSSVGGAASSLNGQPG